jgi:hypothetical protein
MKWKPGESVDPTATRRQAARRQRLKARGYHRLDVFVPPDLMAAIERRWKPEGPWQSPQTAIVELLYRVLRVKRPGLELFGPVIIFPRRG